MKRLAAGAALGVGAGGGAVVAGSGILPPMVNMFLWPGLVALLFLILSIWFGIKGPRVWLWPCVTGFLVQVTGILLILTEQEDQYWMTLIYTAVAVVAVLLIMLLAWVVGVVRARWMERKILDGVGDLAGVDPAKLQELRESMQETLTRLRRMGGRRAVYTLPWQLVTGRSGVGKTVAIKHSGLGLPAKKDRVKGVGGTHTCDYFFTKDLIFLDTPGGWVEEGVDEEGKKIWHEQVRLLKRFRPARPLDGVVVLVSADHLLSKTQEEIGDQAANIREVLDLLQEELRFRFPVYLVISKCDLVEGFVQFFKGLAAQRKSEILGWSNENPNRRNVRPLVLKGFDRVLKRLSAYRLEILARTARVRDTKRLFFFTEEFRRLKRPLVEFADALFERDPEHEPPIFRGFYFTSGTQGEDEDRIYGLEMDDMRQRLGIPIAVHPFEEEEEEPPRGYFLLDLFRQVVVGDQGLLSRSAFHWLRRRRRTLLGAFLPAAVAVLLLLLSLGAYMRYNALYNRIRIQVPQIVADLRDPNSEHDVLDYLEETDKLRVFHKKLTGYTLIPRMGMRRTGDLDDEVLRIYRTQFNDLVLRPTLEKAEAFVTNPDNTCTDRAEILYGVLWLRGGSLAEWSNDLKGFTRIWGVAGRGSEAELRDGLHRQFNYLMKKLPEEERLLPGIDLATAVAALKEKCGQGATSALEQYERFQRECADPPISQVASCYRLLHDAARSGREDYARMTAYMEKVSKSLEELRGKESGAEEAWNRWSGFELPERSANECMDEFEKEIVLDIRAYADQDELVDECFEQYQGAGSSKRSIVTRIMKEQKAFLEQKEDELKNRLQRFSDECGSALGGRIELNPDVLFTLAESYRREACQGFPGSKPPPPPGTVVPKKIRPKPKPEVVEYQFFELQTQIGWSHTEAGLQHKINKVWQTDIDYIDVLPSETQQQQVQRELDGKIRSYRNNYERDWLAYLAGIQLKAPLTDVPDWLAALSTSTEYRDVLKPASEAVSRLGGYPDPPFDQLAAGAEKLAEVPAFVDRRLSEYQQGHLNKVSADLGSCAKDNAFWTRYKARMGNRDQSNSLVAAEQWVEMNAGTNVADGALRKLLLAPLAQARDWVTSPDLTRRQWVDLHQSYGEARSKFPLDASGTELIESGTFAGLFGHKTGQIRVFERTNGLDDLRADQRSWVSDVIGASSIFFVPDTDDLRPLNLTLTWAKTTYDPEKLAKDYQLRAIVLNLAGKEFEVPASPRSESIELQLLDPSMAKSTFVEVTLAKKKGFVKGTFGKKWKEEKRIILETADGWAPLGLFEAGLAEGDVPADSLILRYVIPIVPNENKPPIGTITADLTIEAKHLGEFLRLMHDGFPSPPAAGD